MSQSLRPVRRVRPLSTVAARLGVTPQPGWESVEVSGVTLDSTDVRAGDIFVGRPGEHHHGARFARAAAEAGAVAVVTDAEGAETAGSAGVPVLLVADVAGRVGELAAEVYGHPAAGMRTVGVTGTNGKTTTTWLLEAAWRAAGLGVGLVGTLGVHLTTPGAPDSARRELPSARTTPEATELQALLAVMADESIDHVAMEVSSHALALGRVDGLCFDLGVFTNLTQDHLDFHGDIEHYYAAKASLFTAERCQRGLVCVDDDWGRRLVRESGVPTQTYALDARADWTATDVVVLPDGRTEFVVRSPDDRTVAVALQLPGRFQVANAVAAIAAATMTGLDLEQAAAGVTACSGVPGRMERIGAGQPFLAVVDYAHTPDAIERVLAAVRGVSAGRVVAVLGAGGDRDRAKRPLMGRAAADLADLVVVTDDNPRSEDPGAIRSAVLEGARRGSATVEEVGDRRAAIARAVAAAGPGDAVVLLGKGAETGQELAGTVTPFDDRVELRAALGAAGWGEVS